MKMEKLGLIVFAGFLLVSYLIKITKDKIKHGQWSFGIKGVDVLFSVFVALELFFATCFFANIYVEKNVPHEWREEISSIRKIENVSWNLEEEGTFFLGIGGSNERETLRYTVVDEDGGRVRDKSYTSDCVILKADKEQKIVQVSKVRVYKNPWDKWLFQGNYDKKDSFYRVYLL